MDSIFYANLIKNEAEIILKKLKLKYTVDVEKTNNGASVLIAFTDKNKCNIAFDKLKIRYDKTSLFGMNINVVKKADYIVRINLY